MAYTDPPTFVAGDPLEAAQLNVISDDVRDLHGIAQGVTFSGVKVTRVGTQSIADSTQTDVSFSAETFDYGAWWSSGTTVTVPAGAIPAGFTFIALMIVATIRYASNGTGLRRLYLNNNGTTQDTVSVSALSGEYTYVSSVAVFEAVAADAITMQAWQSSGGSLNIDQCKLTIYRIAPLA